MEIKYIILIVSSVLILIFNPISVYYQNKLHKARTKLLDDRIKNLSQLYLPVLVVMMNYYSDREDYVNAQNCKELIKAITETDKSINF